MFMITVHNISACASLDICINDIILILSNEHVDMLCKRKLPFDAFYYTCLKISNMLRHWSSNFFSRESVLNIQYF